MDTLSTKRNIERVGLTSLIRFIYRGVEQLVARHPHKLEVAGSSPAPASNKDTHSNFLLER